VIVTDTGSTDATIQAIGVFKDTRVRVNKFPWNGSFADARNHGISFSRTQWMMFLDADDRMDKEDCYKMEQVVEALPRMDKKKLYSFIVFNGMKTNSFESPRMWHRDGGFKFRGSIHEVLSMGRVMSEREIINTTLHIEHTGYDKLEAVQFKIKRNFEPLKKDVAADPNDARSRLLLGNTYDSFAGRSFDSPHLKTAFNLFAEVIKITHRNRMLDSEIGYCAIARCVDIYGKWGNDARALKWAKVMRKLREIELYGYVYLAKVYFNMKDYRECRKIIFSAEDKARQTIFFAPADYPGQTQLAKDMLQKCNDELEPMTEEEKPIPQGQLTHTQTAVPNPEVKDMLTRMKEKANVPAKKIQASNPT